MLQTSPRATIPGVWYDLYSTIDSAYQTTCTVREITPNLEGMTTEQVRRVNQMIGVVIAVETLLDLAQKEIEQLELALIAQNKAS